MNLPYTFRKEILNIQPYVPGKPIQEVQRELGIKEIIKMASNENPLGPSPRAQEAIRKFAGEVHIYPDGNCYELRRAVASKYGVEQNQIIFGNGSDEIIELLAQTLINPGDEVITGDPSFSEYDFATYLMGGKLIKVPLNNHRFDLEAMAEAITPFTKLIFVCNPNNPTGTYVTSAELEKFMGRVPDDVVVVFDEAYYEYVEAEDYPETLHLVKEGRKNVIILHTFSKIYALAGLRIGFGLASAELIALLSRTREPFNVNAVAQVAALASLEDQDHVDKSRKANLEGKVFLYRSFEEMGLEYIPTEANFIFVDTGMDSKELFKEMLKKGVIVRTGDIFGRDTFIRVTIGTLEQNQKFINVLKEVLNG